MKRLLYPSLSLVCLLGSMCLLSGCSTSMSMPDTQGTSNFGITKGGVFGGQNPVTGAQVYIFETQPSSGYGTTAPKSLLGVGITGDTCGVSTGSNKLKFPLVQSGSNCYYQTGGYANATAGKTNSAVGNGEFNLTGLYACDVGQEVWIFSISGYTTSSASSLNPYASLMADLGACPASGNFSTDSYIYVNELSTVAMAYSVAGFTADTTGSASGTSITISGPSSNPTGLANAFNNAQQLYNIFGLTDQPDQSAPHTTTYGARNGIPPYELINTLGNALADCINSTGETYPTPASGSACYELFLDVYGNTTTVTDTASAMIHIAKNPLAPNPTNLIALGALDPVWNPYYGVSSAPNDLTASIAYTGGPNYPYGMILDASGNAYVDDYTSNGFMTQYSALGAVTNTSTVPTPIVNAAALAVDSNGLIWTTSLSAGTIYNVSSTSSFGSVTATTAGPMAASNTTYPDLISADTLGNVYIANPYQGTGVVYRTNASGSSDLTITPAIAGNGCITNATGVAVNHDGTLWVSGYGTPDLVCRISNNGSTFYTGAANASGFGSSGVISKADAIAAGSPTCNGSANTGGSGCSWVIDHSDSKLYNVANNGTTSATVTTAGSGGGIASPVDVVVDGNGDPWVLNNNSGTGSISEFSPAGVALSGTNGFQYGSLSSPAALGIDISGNVWVSDTGHGDVVEVIGLSTPTAALSTGNPGSKP